MPKPTITIEYCDECMYLKPALEAAHKILDAYADRVEAVTLKPGHDGVFRVAADGAMIIEMGDEGLPNAERVAHAVGEFLSGRPLPQPLPGTERGAPPSPLGKGAGGLGQEPGERSS
jgi:selenoprotein W-related protein